MKQRRQIASIVTKIKELQAKKKSLELEMMLECPHPLDQIFEVEFGAHYSNSLPYKFCKDCGFGEKGWRQPLFFKEAYHTEVPQVSRQFADKYTVWILNQDEMSAIEYPDREEYAHLIDRVKPFLRELQKK